MRDAILFGEGDQSGLHDLNLAVRIAQMPDDAGRLVPILIEREGVVEALGQGIAGIQVRVGDRDLLLNLNAVVEDRDDIPPRVVCPYSKSQISPAGLTNPSANSSTKCSGLAADATGKGPRLPAR